MARIAPINYQGPNTDFKPHIGDLSSDIVSSNNPITIGDGYHDLDYLLNLLEELHIKMVTIYQEASNQLGEFGLIIDPNQTSLLEAQKIVYPSTDPPLTITFEEYKYLQVNNNSNAAQYIISAYEEALRGPSGSNALDISDIASYISNEITRIKDFIDGYIGEVDDTSEQRTVELFQDWAEDTSAIVEKFWQALKGQISVRLPQSELDQISTETAPKLQALFQVKLNRINKNIKDLKGQLLKNWESTSQIFYEKHLGPALKFQLKVGRNVGNNIDQNTMPVIASEIAGTMAGIDSNFSGILADQIKRNKIFIQSLSEIILNIAQRDTYFSYMKDLTGLGKPLPTVFTNSLDVIHPEEINNAISSGVTILNNKTVDSADNFNPIHSALTGIEDPLAHPQYLLRTGGLDSIITGDIFLAENVRFDGIIPSEHRHTGEDGSQKIRGSDIDNNSITEENINTVDPTTSIPTELVLVSQSATLMPTGSVKVTARVSFNVTTSSNITGYEFEVLKI
jgi:hypothetical protein